MIVTISLAPLNSYKFTDAVSTLEYIGVCFVKNLLWYRALIIVTNNQQRDRQLHLSDMAELHETIYTLMANRQGEMRQVSEMDSVDHHAAELVMREGQRVRPTFSDTARLKLNLGTATVSTKDDPRYVNGCKRSIHITASLAYG